MIFIIIHITLNINLQIIIIYNSTLQILKKITLINMYGLNF
jgi:hypothetical protein